MELNSGDTAWVLASTALVLLMTPGLAFFYGGMTRAKSTLNMMMMSFASIGIVSIIWVIYGYSLAFGDSGNAFYGAFEPVGLGQAVGQLTNNGGVYGIPLLAFASFQLMFAIITVALISGAIADRAKFLTWSIFAVLWVTIVYFPVAHWVFDFGTVAEDGTVTGGLAGRARRPRLRRWHRGPHQRRCCRSGARDRARSTDRLQEAPDAPAQPAASSCSAPVCCGSAGSASTPARRSAPPTPRPSRCSTRRSPPRPASAAGSLVERIRDGHATSLGAASGAVAGLVAITPACAFVEPWAAVVIGLIAGIVCALAVGLKYKLNYDDSLDVVGVHLVGGLIGCLLIGFFATTLVNEFGADGALLRRRLRPSSASRRSVRSPCSPTRSSSP